MKAVKRFTASFYSFAISEPKLGGRTLFFAQNDPKTFREGPQNIPEVPRGPWAEIYPRL